MGCNYTSLPYCWSKPWHVHTLTVIFWFFLCLQRPLKTQNKHTRKHLPSAIMRCTPHIPSAWAWHLTSLSSITRFWTPLTKPVNWLKRSADYLKKNQSLSCVLSCNMLHVLTFSLLLTGIRRCHFRAGQFKWGVLQRQHSHHAAPQRQSDSKCLLSRGTKIIFTV